nr:MAG TPA: hypothetical protein [Caudoviricetes sp.]
MCLFIRHIIKHVSRIGCPTYMYYNDLFID